MYAFLFSSGSPLKVKMYSGRDRIKDSAWPNEMWSKEAVELFNKLCELGSDWKKLCRDSSLGQDGSRLFLNAYADQEHAKLFEYAMFHNAKLKHLKAVVQFGLYTRGPIL